MFGDPYWHNRDAGEQVFVVLDIMNKMACVFVLLVTCWNLTS